MGAGLSGLACAITLEQHGLEPVIFEKRSRPGDRFPNGEVMMPMLSNPILNPYAFFAEKHDIYLQPLSNIRRLVVTAPHSQAVFSGDIGFSNLRGRDADSFENQLARQVTSRIHYNSKATYEELLHDYTHVILATGDLTYTGSLQDYQPDLAVNMRGATVAGDFQRDEVRIWLDNRFAPRGYGFLIPLSNTEASLQLAYPDYPENQTRDRDQMWDTFVGRVREDMEQDMRPTDFFDISRYMIGICRHPRIGNTFFVGNCFGAITPAFGFGQTMALLTGIYAAYDLCGLGKYETLVEPLRQSYRNSLALRRAIERLNNKRYDVVISALNNRFANRLLTDQSINTIKLVSFALRPWVRLSRRSAARSAAPVK